jgi:putative PIG3 family NAD(P)H quinone oxidoreductase
LKAVRIREPGGAEVLELVDVPTPVPAAGEALVRVRAAGLNRADLLQRAGKYPAPPGAPVDVPGLEFAGEVVEFGPCAGRPGETAARAAFTPGTAVMGITGGGGYAEYLTVPAEHLMPIPGGLSIVEAGGIPEVFLTASDALFSRGELRADERVLIHSAGGGVGSAALQLARAAGASGICGTASAGKLASIRAAGLPLDLGVDYARDDFAAAIALWTDGAGVDVIIDTVGAPYWKRNVASLAELGRLVIVGVMGGSLVEADLRALMAKRATVVGTVLRARSIEEKAAVTRRFVDRFLAGFDTAPIELRPIIDRVLPLDAAAEAHRYLESNRSFGKVVLEV